MYYLQACPTSFSTIELSNSLFKRAVPDAETFLPSENGTTDALDVGFSRCSYSEDDEIVDFQLAFLIKPLNMINTVPNQDKIRSCPLFGEVIDGEGVLEVLSRKRKTERSGFKVWIEFQRWKDSDGNDDTDESDEVVDDGEEEVEEDDGGDEDVEDDSDGEEEEEDDYDANDDDNYDSYDD